LHRKLTESRLDYKIPLHQLDFNITYDFGPLSVELVQLTHSVPDPAALVLRSDKGTVLHTGDWKFDETPMLGKDTDRERLRQIGDEGVMALIGDSTNAMVDGYTPSEAVALQGLTDVIAEAEGLVAVTCFASNVARLGSIMTAAAANNRSICVVGRALNRTIGAARDTGYLADIPDFVCESEASLIPRNHMVVICTGSQGETRAAMAKIAAGTHESVELQPGDTVIYSSRQIPGNEPAITKVQDMLVRRGIHLITDEDRPVHVSGHPARDELVEMYGLVRPQIAIPVHGTARHLMAHAELANNCQVKQTLIPDNGATIRLKSGTADIIGYAPVGLLTPEGGEVVDLQSDHLRSRRRMLWNGTVTATVVLSAVGELLMAPQVSQTGLCPDHQSADFIADASLAVEDVICQRAAPGDNDEVIEEMVRRTVGQMAKGKFKLRPTVHVHVMRTDITGVSA
jgi:ribonuclease J